MIEINDKFGIKYQHFKFFLNFLYCGKILLFGMEMIDIVYLMLVAKIYEHKTLLLILNGYLKLVLNNSSFF